MAAAPKTCELDPVPSFLVQELIDGLLSFLTVLCNRSIQEAYLPTLQKRSILLPKLKREGLDSTDPSNYRPIANVTFLSKILERIIANQLLVHLDVNVLFPPLQSGFRRNHSTGTLLVCLLSDFYGAMDCGQITLLALFNVSAAFNSVDHSILLNRLSVSFGLIGKPLEWLRSFLTDRTHCVVVGSSRSCWVPALFGVPKGSVLGPLLYILYTADIGSLMQSCGLLHQLYADDIQAYIHCNAADAVASVGLMCSAIDALSRWMAPNHLLLNASTTQFIWLGGRRQLAKVDLRMLADTFPHVAFSTTVRDLGLTLNQELNFSEHVNLITRSCYYQLRQLRVVMRSLSHDASVVLVHAFVTSRIDHIFS